MEREEQPLQDNRKSNRKSSPSSRKRLSSSASTELERTPTDIVEFEPAEYSVAQQEPKEPIIRRTFNSVRAQTSKAYVQLENKWKEIQKLSVTKLSYFKTNVAPPPQVDALEKQNTEQLYKIFTKLATFWLLCALLWSYFWKINQTKLF
jgi:hypothetical protein